jgi:hypothetical protein
MALELDSIFTERALTLHITRNSTINASSLRKETALLQGSTASAATSTQVEEEVALKYITDYEKRNIRYHRPIKSGARKSAAKRARSSRSPAYRIDYRLFYLIREELHDLICTKSKKYTSLRSKLSSDGKTTQTALVSLIATSIGQFIGMSGAIVSTIVALFLLTAIRVGREVVCRMWRR